MTRHLSLICIASFGSLLAAGCGDDDGNAATQLNADGGVIDQLDNLSNALGGFEDSLADTQEMLGGEIDDLNDGLTDAGTQISGLQDDVDGLQQDIEDILSPDNCSAEEICILDGVDEAAAAIAEVITALCEHEIDCCDERELALRLGAGIENVEDCVNRFRDLVANGQSPDLLQHGGQWVANAIAAAQAINSNDVQVTLDTAAAEACAEHIRDWTCTVEPGEPGEVLEHCVTQSYEPEADLCALSAIVIGAQAAGAICNVTAVEECEPGLVCRETSGPFGICAQPSEPGDGCQDDGDCDGEEQFCNHATNQCTQRGALDERCAYVDPTFLVDGFDLYPGMDEGLFGWQNPGAVKLECQRGLLCDPIERVCVDNCSEHALCNSNLGCPEDHVCNFTELPDLMETWGFGVCTAPIAAGDPCTLSLPQPNGEAEGPECATGRCADEGAGNVCVAKLKAAGTACDTAGADATCASGHCNTDLDCARLCDSDTVCPNGFYCDLQLNAGAGLFYDPVQARTQYPCEPKKANTVACTAANVPGVIGVNYECNSGRCAALACAAKLASAAVCASHEDCPQGTHYCGYSATNAQYECTAFLGTDGNCSNAFVGPQALPTQAYYDHACGPGAWCWYDTPNTTYKCKPLADDTESCDVANGLYCDANGVDNVALTEDDLACVNIGANDRCHKVGEFPTNGDCTQDANCASRWCSTNGFTCQPRIAADADCDATDPLLDHCVDGHYCKHDPAADESDTGRGKCTPQGLPGEPCNPRYDAYPLVEVPPASGLYYRNPLNVNDCLGELAGVVESNNCSLFGDEFVCNQASLPVGGMLCDGEDP